MTPAPSTNDSRLTAAGRAAVLAVALAGLWILAGAVFKLLWGTPALLPRVVRDLPLSIGLTYRLAIAVELTVAVLAFLAPRLAWPLLVGALLVFDLVLVTQIREGAESCGCFGARVHVPPAVMLAIDSVLLVGILAARPWRSLRAARVRPVAALVLVAVLAGLPWLLDREAGGPTRVEADGTPLAAGRSWVQLDVASWVGEDLGETPLARYVDVYSMPPDALWVLYRSTCEHCAEHLAFLADAESGQRMLVLCRLKEEGDTERNRVVHRLPTGPWVFECELPPDTDYIVTTPAELEVEAFRVVRAAEGVSPEGH